MPRSKRNKVVSLTKTNSKGNTHKTKLVENLRSSINEYSSIYVFSFENFRTSKFADIRMDWRESRIFMGKKTVAQIALGRNVEEEYKDNLHNVSDSIDGNTGLLFTNRGKEEVLRYFSDFSYQDFAKAGTVPNEDVIIPAGETTFPVSMMDELRKLGLVVEADDGKVILRSEFTAASAGSALTPEQARILVKLDRRIVEFKIKLICYWNDGEFEVL